MWWGEWRGEKGEEEEEEKEGERVEIRSEEHDPLSFLPEELSGSHGGSGILMH